MTAVKGLYDEGTELVAWEEGYSLATGTFTKNVDNIAITAGSASAACERSMVITDAIDLTDWDYFVAELTVGGSSSTGNVIAAVASSTKTDAMDVFDHRVATGPGDSASGHMVLDGSSRWVLSLDVRALSGPHYLRLHARDNSATLLRTSELTMHRSLLVAL